MAMRDSNRRNRLSFTVDAQLIGELGERLVTKNHVALSELIKNAFDADATRIVISFENARGTKKNLASQIVIEDNGSGMTGAIVESDWMLIGTANKQRQPVSAKYGRLRTGSKGIGRFACERLSHRLELETVGAKGRRGHRREKTSAVFDWDKYSPGKKLSEIQHTISTETTDEKTYTRLTLSKLRDRWIQRDFNTLRREIIDLTVAKPDRRKGYENDPGFEIDLVAPEFEFGEGTLLGQFMDAGWGVVSGQFSKRGVGTLALTCMRASRSNKPTSRTYSLKFPDKLTGLAGVSFKFSFLPINKNYWRDRSTVNLGTVKEALREKGGIRIYQNQFRIYPYGSPGDDWLDLEKDYARRLAKFENQFLSAMANRAGLDPARLMLEAPRYRSLYGFVIIDTDSSKHFEVNISRDGLIEGDAYRDLQKVLRFAIQWLTIHFANFKDDLEELSAEQARHRLGSTGASPEDRPNPQATTATALRIVEKASKSAQKSSVAERRELQDASTILKADIQGRQGELALLRTFSSTGPLIFAFTHEIRAVINSMESYANILKELSGSLPPSEQKSAIALSEGLLNTKSRFIELSNLFNIMGNAANLEPKRFFLYKVVEQIHNAFAFVLNDYKISWEKHISNKIKTPLITQAELHSIIVNLVSNAIKASVAAETAKRAIAISAVVSDDGVRLHVDDKGLGLPKKHWTEVFDPLVSDPTGVLYGDFQKVGDESVYLLGRGSGLGLSIVSKIVERYGGSVSFEDAPEGWSTRISVGLPSS